MCARRGAITARPRVYNLRQSLQDHDRGHLAIVAELWGLSLASAPAAQAAEALSHAMLQAGAVEEVLEALPERARQALRALQLRGGQMPLADLTRQFGALREMGAAKRDREKPWRHPASAVEALWYRGLIGRRFADTPKGLEEFGYIPQELLARLPQPEAPPGIGLEPPELVPRHIQPAGMLAVDDATTVLAAYRLPPAARPAALAPHLFQPASLELLLSALQDLGCLRPPALEPDPSQTRLFLEAPRPEGLLQLLRGWIEAPIWNDLAQVDGLLPPKSSWPNHPRANRQATLALLGDLPPGRWWSLAGFQQTVREHRPSFLRTVGEFDSWYLQDSRSGQFLQGMEAWNRVEGALLAYLLTGPLHWLGAVDLGTKENDAPYSSFRLTEVAQAALGQRPAPSIEKRERRARIAADGRITVPRESPRPLRYQVARFSRWIRLDRGRETYQYQLAPAAMQSGREAGLLPRHVLAILQEVGQAKLPGPLMKAIRRWEQRGVEAELSRKLVLRVADSRVMDELQANPTTARYLIEVLDDTQAVVAQADWRALCAAALRKGMLIGWPADPGDEPAPTGEA